MVSIIKKKLPISYYQKFFWLEWKLDPNSAKYNTSLVYRIHGNLKEEALQRALNTYIQDFHQAARYYFQETPLAIEQILEERLNVCLEKEELLCPLENVESENIKSNILTEIEKFIKKYCDYSFNLTEPPLFKFGLLKISDKDFILVLNYHHIITDAFTGEFIVQTVSELYNHYAHGTPITNALPITFLEYILREEEFYSLEQRRIDLDYWKNKLAGRNLTIPLLPELSSSVPLEDQGSGTYSFFIDAVNTKLLKQLAAKEHTTLFIVLTSIFAVLLYRYTQQEDICISYLVNTRSAGFKKLPGCFVNIVPIILTMKEVYSFQEIIHLLTLERKEAKAHQKCSLADIMQFLKEEGAIKANDHLNIGFSETFLNVDPLRLEGLHVECFPVNPPENANDLLLLYQESDKLEFKINYQKNLFKEQFIQQISKHFQRILEKCIEDAQQNITYFSLLSDMESHIILKDWNNTEKLFPDNKTICQLFEEQVTKTPNNNAVFDERQILSFDTLNKKANQLARAIVKTLNQKNNGKSAYEKQPIVAVCLDRTLELVVGILGILKANACYLPVSLEDTEFRIQTMLRDAKVALVLTLKQTLKEKPILKDFENVILIDNDWKFISKLSDENLQLPYQSRNLAYVIYTSGTTGAPKGVMIEHRSVVNIILDIKNKFKVTEKDKIFNLAPMAFDIYGLELFLALLSGACHILCSSVTTQDPKRIVDRIVKTNPTIVNASPSLWSILLKYLKKKKRGFVIFSTAEPLSFALARKLKLISNGVWDLYGPTETTIVSSFEKIEDRTPGIGRAFANTKLYVLDKNLNPVPIGAVGELYISGVGVARGYLNDVKLTEQKFVKNIFSNTDEFLMYKTGDYVRWRYDGTLEYLGRDDRQIKIRGFRVELAEIESFLFAYPDFIDCTVNFFNENDQSYLVAYYVLKSSSFFSWFSENKKLDVEKLSHYLKKHLPSQMQPTAFVQLKEIPRTVTGKVNKLKLPKPEITDFAHGEKFVRAYDSTELKLKEIWLDLLKLAGIGIHDDFFLIGGHSLAAVYLITKINEAFKVQYPVSWVTKFRTIRMQADQIRKEEKSYCVYHPIIQFNSLQNSTVIQLNEAKACISSDDVPLVFIHSALAGAEVYDKIATHFGNHIAFYAIDSYNLNSGKPYLETVEALALEYIGYLRQIKPKGPYLLGGWSFGGTIAYEMAQQLTKMGEIVTKIYLIDGHLFNREYIENLYNVIQVEDLVGAVSESWMEYFKRLPKKYLDRVFTSLQNDVRMVMRYTVKPYAGPVMLLKSTKLRSSKFLKLYKIFLKNMHNNWKPYVKDLEVKLICSDHFDLIEGEKSKEVAKIIESDITELKQETRKKEPVGILD